MNTKINNEIYNELGEKWYKAYDDPVALLRAQSLLFIPWLDKEINAKNKTQTNIAELGCGAGFLTNGLSQLGYKVTGLDLSKESLEVAKKHDKSNTVSYVIGDVTACPLENNSYDIVISFDVAEHIEEPNKLIAEAYRILKPGGKFFFHTFNRNIASYLVVIKCVEWFVKNTPKHLHVLDLFIKPQEFKQWCNHVGFTHTKFLGVRPSLRSLLDPCVFRGHVPKNLSFKFTKSLWMSYCGYSIK